MTWLTLLRASGLAVVALLVCAVAGFLDLEAAAMALGGGAGLLLLRWRTGLAGELGLGVLFANTGAWMTPGAISNLRHHENWVASALPASLAILSVAGLLAAVALLAARRVRVPAGHAPRAVAIVAVALVAAANIAGALGQVSGHIDLLPGDLTLTAQHVRFSETHLEAKAGRVGLVLSNLDLFWHTFTITSLDVDLNVPVQAERRIEFDAPPGTYEFVCKIPGHVQAGR
jgi:hypothetical protein